MSAITCPPGLPRKRAMVASSQILTVEQMQAAERQLMDGGTGVDALMQTAGRGAAEWVWRTCGGRAVTVLCGPGNNGGDGYVIAEVLRSRGIRVKVVAPIAPTTDAAKNARSGYAGEIATSGREAHGEILVDCLFGSGLSRPLSGELSLLLRDLSARHPYRIAVDLPSGVESDRGELLNANLPQCQLTLALGAWKIAHWTLPGAKIMGERRLVPIGIEPQEGAAQLIGKPRLSGPAVDAHKYTRGLCAVVGGEMPGAALLSATSAQRAGAGYVKLLSEHSHPSAPAGLVIEDGPLTEALSDERIAALLIGPGLGRSEEAKARLGEALCRDRPMLLDADALTILTPDMLPDAPQILATPHEGELETLCRNFAIVASGKQAKAQALAKTSGMVVLAKGADTLIASPDGRLAIAPSAPSWLSVAGSGDVLAGIAASRMATGVAPFEAACEAVWLHGEAARLAGPAFTADELAAAVSGAMGACL